MGQLSLPFSSKHFYSKEKSGGVKMGEIKTINSCLKISKHGVSAASVYTINDWAKGIAFIQVPPDTVVEQAKREF